MFCYFNNGMSMKGVGLDYQPQDGEIVLGNYATEQQLQSSFPEYNSKKDYENIKSQIRVLESSQTSRRIRESILGIDNGWLSNINAQISDLRSKL